MAVRTTGAEFKRFYADPTYWPTDEGSTYHEDEIITVNGAEQPDGVDVDELTDDAAITIEGGIVFGPKWNENEPSLEGYFRKWRKQQNTASFLVECDITKIEAIKAAIKAAGGRVGS